MEELNGQSFDDDLYLQGDPGIPNPSPKDYLNETDKSLYDLTALAKDPKIIGIRDYFTRKGFISIKQRWCLCVWISDKENKDSV